MADENTPQLKSVDILGKSFELPVEAAEQIIKLRDASKADQRGDLDTRLAEIETRIKQETEAKFQADFEKRLEEHKSNNNVDEIKTMLEERHAAQLKQVAIERDGLMSKIVDGSIKDSFRSIPDIIPDVVDDAVIIYKNQFNVSPDGYVTTKDGSAVFGENGDKARVQDHVKKFVESRKQYVKANVNKGTGADDAHVDAGEGKTSITRAQYEATVSAGGPKARKMVEGVAKGVVLLTD